MELLPTPVATHVEFNQTGGVMAAVHFTKGPNGCLSIAISTVVPGSPQAVLIDAADVPGLVRSLIGGFMLPTDRATVNETYYGDGVYDRSYESRAEAFAAMNDVASPPDA